MKVGTLLGIIMIVVGAIALAYGGITYTNRKDTVSLGPVEVTATEKKTLPLPPILGGVLVAAGIVVVLATKRAS